MDESALQSMPYRRTVVLDIETLSLDPDFPKGALDALTGRVVCVGMLIDDGRRLFEIAIACEDEAKILTEFWNTIYATDILVGFNLIEFDLAFVRRRSWICNVRPTRSLDLRRYYSTHVDVMQLWTNWSFRKFVSLDALSAALNCGQKSAHGEDVAAMWAAGDLDRIKTYCLEDVRITYRLYCRLTYQPPRMSDVQSKAKVPVTSFGERTTPAGSNGEPFGRESGLFPKMLVRDSTNLQRASSALTTRRRKS